MFSTTATEARAPGATLKIAGRRQRRPEPGKPHLHQHPAAGRWPAPLRHDPGLPRLGHLTPGALINLRDETMWPVSVSLR